jgi:2-polyprenyl-3-methyl-5-hydroxy-6-metoxy-1,4-benzoquinol methylase
MGCANGYPGRILINQRGCTVSGIEIDPAAAEAAGQTYHDVIVGDVEENGIFSRLQYKPCDVIIFGDVLEHLRRPEIVLVTARSILKLDGYVLISLPNVVTLRLRLCFLLGHFDYTEQGIMDQTHLRFLTLRTAHELIQTCGYYIEHFDFVIGPNFWRYLQWWHIPKRWLPPSIFGTQFVFKVCPEERSQN